MKPLDQIDLAEAESIFAIANTPHFLIEKLRTDPAVRSINSTYKGEDVLKELEVAVQKKPLTLSAAVRPYAYLVALSFNPNISYLKRATKLPAPNFDWFEYLGNVLIKEYQSTSDTIFNAPAQLTEAPSSYRIKASTKASKTNFIIPPGTNE